MWTEIDLSKIKPADYNPRKLSENAFENLKNSISKLGVIKPIIVRKENMTIVAGHQRVKTMLALGMKTSPAFILEGVNMQDEVRFNQFHNMVEYEMSEKAPDVTVPELLPIGFSVVKHQDINIKSNGTCGALNSSLTTLLLKYGEFASIVCDKNGKVIVSAAYALSCKTLKKDVLVYCADERVIPLIEYYFKLEYGTFNYTHIEKKTYMQTLAQLSRLRTGRKGIGNSFKSTLYSLRVIPHLKKVNNERLRIIDFGAGKKDYYKLLKNNGYNITSVDPYNRIENKNAIDNIQNTKDFLKICSDLKLHGRYDVVICDSVLNSVDSLEAEKSVMLTLLALCKKDGIMFFSGRTLAGATGNMKTTNTKISKDSRIKFLDENNFTGIYRNGEWFFQKFHSSDQIKTITKWVSASSQIIEMNGVFHVICKNDGKGSATQDEIIKALRFEWDMMLPGGLSYGLSDEIENAYKYAIENENTND